MMEVEVHDCPACGIDHQSLDFEQVEETNIYLGECPETLKVLVMVVGASSTNIEVQGE